MICFHTHCHDCRPPIWCDARQIWGYPIIYGVATFDPFTKRPFMPPLTGLISNQPTDLDTTPKLANRNEVQADLCLPKLLTLLALDKDANVLEVGCGRGKNSSILAANGLNVIGFDTSVASIVEAQKLERPRLKFFRHDIREPFASEYFDAVFSFFTSFGSFDRTDNAKVIGNLANALREGGTLVLDYVDIEFSTSNLVPAKMQQSDGIVYGIHQWVDDRFLYKKVQVFNYQSETPTEYSEKIARLNLQDFRDMFLEYDLEIEHIFGDYSFNPHQPGNSPRLFMIARKVKSK
jgi:SAM-dependent methyltransferase